MSNPIDRGHQHTNASLRALLGEAGYLRTSPILQMPPQITEPTKRVTMWRRGKDSLWLIETTDNTQPYLCELSTKSFARIDPKLLGVRNPNTQTGNKP